MSDDSGHGHSESWSGTAAITVVGHPASSLLSSSEQQFRVVDQDLLETSLPCYCTNSMRLVATAGLGAFLGVVLYEGLLLILGEGPWVVLPESEDQVQLTALLLAGATLALTAVAVVVAVVAAIGYKGIKEAAIGASVESAEKLVNKSAAQLRRDVFAYTQGLQAGGDVEEAQTDALTGEEPE